MTTDLWKGMPDPHLSKDAFRSRVLDAIRAAELQHRDSALPTNTPAAAWASCL